MKNASSQFEGVLDRYFEKRLEENPLSATYAGLKSGEGQLGTATPDFEKRQEKKRQAALQALEKISPGGLSNDQQLDRLALHSQLTREAEDFARGRHTLDPSGPDQILSILLQFLPNFF